MDAPYTRTEMKDLQNSLPVRGPVCLHCKGHIPQFAELRAVQRFSALAHIRSKRILEAMATVQNATGCCPLWAKIWAVHHGQPQPRFTGPPCPFCGAPLPSNNSRQCLSCKADWHGTPGPNLEPAPPPRGSLLWSGIVSRTRQHILFEDLRLTPPNKPLEAFRSSWVLSASSIEGESAQYAWSPTQLCFEDAPPWDINTLRVLESTLSNVAAHGT